MAAWVLVERISRRDFTISPVLSHCWKTVDIDSIQAACSQLRVGLQFSDNDNSATAPIANSQPSIRNHASNKREFLVHCLTLPVCDIDPGLRITRAPFGRSNRGHILDACIQTLNMPLWFSGWSNFMQDARMQKAGHSKWKISVQGHVNDAKSCENVCVKLFKQNAKRREGRVQRSWAF